jgi:ribosome-binding protein aMBF1 (putative translation factor)
LTSQGQDGFESPILATLDLVATFPDLLRDDRERRGFTVGQVAWRLGVKRQQYRELEAGKRCPDFDMWDRICKLARCR